jgi:hypothetical protein
MITSKFNCKFSVSEPNATNTSTTYNEIHKDIEGNLQKLSASDFSSPMGDMNLETYRLICKVRFAKDCIVDITDTKDEIDTCKGKYKVTNATPYPFHCEYELQRIENV